MYWNHLGRRPVRPTLARRGRKPDLRANRKRGAMSTRVVRAKSKPHGASAAEASFLAAMADKAQDAARLLKLLANENRLLILCFLTVRGEMTVGALVAAVRLSQS